MAESFLWGLSAGIIPQSSGGLFTPPAVTEVTEVTMLGKKFSPPPTAGSDAVVGLGLSGGAGAESALIAAKARSTISRFAAIFPVQPSQNPLLSATSATSRYLCAFHALFASATDALCSGSKNSISSSIFAACSACSGFRADIARMRDFH